MTTFELLDFTEAKDQVKSGQYNLALPKLYRLAGSYPNDQEIQDLIKLCLNMQQTQPTAATGQYYYQPPPVQPQPVYQTNYMPIVPAQKNQTWIYALPGVGILTMLVSIFLPWLNMGFGNSAGFYEFSLNGLGTPGGSMLVASAIKPADLATITEPLKGWYLVAGIFIMVVLLIHGVVSRKPFFALLLLIASLIVGGFLGWQYLQVEDFSATATANLKAWYTSNLSTSVGSLTPGYGLIVGCMGAGITIVGAIIAPVC